MRCDAQLAKTRIKWAGEISGLNCPVGELSVVKFVGGGNYLGKMPGKCSGRIVRENFRVPVQDYNNSLCVAVVIRDNNTHTHTQPLSGYS